MAYQTYPTTPPTQERGKVTTRIRAGFGLRGPRREQHVLAPADLAALSFPVGDDGVLIGEDYPEQRPSVLGLFRPTAYDVVLVGGVWTAQILALRAAATGARVAVETARPQLWAPLAQAAGGGQPCVTVHQIGRLGAQGASVAAPVLVVRDLGPKPPRSRLSATPWQSTLTLLPFLGPNAARVLNSADLVGIQRVSPPEAELLGRLLTVSTEDVTALPTLGDEYTLWATRIRRQYVRLDPVQPEQQLLGPARRVD
ncbi:MULTISPECIES: hypothetical protein [Kitasatospora]|uniref:hypothetical protein n=1 Tax=Kitasatospora TaxID=2063 RepID=UPI000C7076A7|nr:hypothetical protein [Kitasatospora sp. GP30]MDH6144799.1 hypothetical protein [Kitasatospora sp. GP30]